ncbi:ABC transporter permease [Pseudoroseicyclus sp. H15]
MDMTSNLASTAARPPRYSRKGVKGLMRFFAIWIALAVLVALCLVFVPRAVSPMTFRLIMPFIAFLAIAAMGQAIVLMARGIDLSVPGIVAMSSAVVLGVSSGSDDRMWLAIAAALGVSTLLGLINGLLVAVMRLNALIVTLASGSIITGLTLLYRQGFAAEARVPDKLAAWASMRLWAGIPLSAVVALVVMVLLIILLRKTVLGRRFEAVGANPEAAHATGIEIIRYQAGAFALAGLLYGLMAILLSGFIRNPTLEVGNAYLLAPIAAAVLGGTAMSGGVGSMLAVTGAAIFLILLDQASKMLGLATSWQMIIQGAAIAAGMWLSEATARAGRGRS